MSEALWGVIIGGAIAIFPPMFTAIFQSINENKKEKRKNKQMAYDKIIRFLFHSLNWDYKTSSLDDINSIIEEMSVLAILHCNFKIQKMVSEYNNLFQEYLILLNKGAKEQSLQARENLKDTCKQISRQISIDINGKKH